MPGDRLTRLGWDSSWAEKLRGLGEAALTPARVVGQRKGSYRVWDAQGELTAVPSGKLRHEEAGNDRYPAVGDWVAVTPSGDDGKAVIRAVLPRKSKFSRQVSGGRDRRSGGWTGEQVVAANVDTAFIVSGLDGGRNLSPGRIERYLALSWSSGAAPVVVLNKMDACPDIAGAVRDVETVAAGVPIHAVSATERLGLDVCRASNNGTHRGS
jgi:ribosome biogenesis GTPase